MNSAVSAWQGEVRSAVLWGSRSMSGASLLSHANHRDALTSSCQSMPFGSADTIFVAKYGYGRWTE